MNLVKTQLNFANAPKVLFELEKRYYQDTPILLDSWDMWHLIKVPLFYELIREKYDDPKNVSPLLPIKKYLHYVVLNLKNVGKASRPEGNSTCLAVLKKADERSIDGVKKHFAVKVPEILFPNDYELLGDLELTGKQSYKEFLNQIEYRAHLKRPFVRINQGAVTQMAKRLELYLEHYEVRFDLKTWLSSYLRGFKASYLVWKHFLKSTRYKYILTSEIMCTPLLAAARTLNIATIELQHGGISAYYPPYVWLGESNSGNKTILKPDYIFCFGEVSKKIITRTGGFSDAQIVPIGSEIIETLRSKEKRSDEKPGVVIVLQPLMSDHNTVLLNSIAKIVTDHPHVDFQIKLHPLQTDREVESIREFVAQHEQLSICDSSLSMYDLLLTADIIVGRTSTVLEEATALGIPALSVVSEELPTGHHDFIGLKTPENPVQQVDMKVLSEKLNALLNKETQSNWSEELGERKYAFYAKGFESNIRNIKATNLLSA